MSGTLQKANRPHFLSKRSIVYILQVPGTLQRVQQGYYVVAPIVRLAVGRISSGRFGE